MKQYSIKSTQGCCATLDVLCEVPDGYFVRVTHAYEGYEEVSESVMSRQLFELCLRTRFIRERVELAVDRVA